MEQTLVVLKPDAVARGLVGEIVARFERVGLKLVGAKLMVVSKEMADKHYPADREEFIKGMGNKTLENYKSLGIDPVKEFGHEDAHKIGPVIVDGKRFPSHEVFPSHDIVTGNRFPSHDTFRYK